MRFAGRMTTVHRSFIREILKAAVDPEIISFAGGLPNPRFFPVRELDESARKVLAIDGGAALQYATTEGYAPLREKIAERYARRGTRVNPDEILILNGSQQGLDLAAKIFLDKGDEVLVESPSYLAALQSFGLFEPRFRGLPMDEHGVDASRLAEALRTGVPKLFYAIPNFQNPCGITYSADRRKDVARAFLDSDTVLVEDDPYGEIRFLGTDIPSVRTFMGAETGSTESCILLGTFSKIVSPGMRLGWMCAGHEVMERLIIAKQAADLHSNEFTQRVIYRYLCDYSIEEYISRTRAAYRRQRDAMVQAANNLFPAEVTCTQPEGGMFLWMTLPPRISALQFFEKALDRKVTFVPGQAFFADGGGTNTLRLNFSNTDEAVIAEGMERLARVYAELKMSAAP
jgi:2-aminoadipate transaminase